MVDPDTPVPMSLQVLRDIKAQHQYQTCTWPADEKGQQSIQVVDAQTANILLATYGLLERDDMKAKFVRMIGKSSEQFAIVMEFCLEHTIVKSNQTGSVSGSMAAAQVAAKLKR